MATNKILHTLCFIALLSTSLSLPLAVEEAAKVEANPVKVEEKSEVVQDVPKPVIVEHQVVHQDQPAGREEPVVEVQPQVIVHEPGVVQPVEDEIKALPQGTPIEPVGVELSAGGSPDDLAGSPDAQPGAPDPESGSDLETANTFGFGWGYRPYYGGGWRRGWYGRGYGGYGGWGGYGYGYPRYGHGWGHGYGYFG